MLLIFTLISFLISTVLCACPSGTEPGGASGLCYKPFPNRATWYQGENTCVQNGGHLASVKDVFTAAFLSGLADFPFNHTDFWVGGTTNFLGGMWSWTDFTSFTYKNWAAGQPNNSLGYCLVQRVADGMWISVDCTQQKPFICAFPQVQDQACTCPTAAPCASSQPTTQTSQNPCPNSNWYYAESFKKCYYYSADILSWNDSYTTCQNLSNNSSLVIIKSNEENNFVSNYILGQNPSAEWTWLGLRLVNGNYTWVDGSPLTYANWYSGYPQNIGCIHMDTYDPYTGYWIDDYCYNDDGITYICEHRL